MNKTLFTLAGMLATVAIWSLSYVAKAVWPAAFSGGGTALAQEAALKRAGTYVETIPKKERN